MEYIKKINLRTIFFSAVRQNVSLSLAFFVARKSANKFDPRLYLTVLFATIEKKSEWEPKCVLQLFQVSLLGVGTCHSLVPSNSARSLCDR